VRAVVLEDYNEPLVVRDVEPLPLGPSDVRVEVRACGVCHSDLSAARGQYAFPLPLVLGHEGSGVVTEVGSSLTAFRVGERVIGSWVAHCGRCFQCLSGRSHLCEAQPVIGARPRVRLNGDELTAMSGLGAMAELMTVDESSLVKVDTDLPDDQLALVGCAVTTGIGAALWTARVQPGSSVAIFGAGGVGLCTVLGAAIAGAAEIIVVDPYPLKREAALSHGATRSVSPADGDPVEQIRACTAGRGADYTFEAIGLPATMRQAFDAACNGGIVTYIGALAADLELPLPANALRAQGKQIRGSNYGSAQVRRDMPLLVRLAETGRLNLAGMVSRRVPLDQVNQAIAAIDQGQVIRSVLIP